MPLSRLTTDSNSLISLTVELSYLKVLLDGMVNAKWKLLVIAFSELGAREQAQICNVKHQVKNSSSNMHISPKDVMVYARSTYIYGEPACSVSHGHGYAARALSLNLLS